MEETPLAMASVPVQKWGRRYDDAKALEQGTIFPDLDKPFFAAETLYFPGKSQEQTERDRLLTKIRQTGFVLDDLTLYLDTHQDGREAAQLYREKSREKEQLMGCFAEQFYPLTRSCAAECGKTGEGFCWLAGPMPWEGGCDHVVL